jgi:ankyrin repeat protein
MLKADHPRTYQIDIAYAADDRAGATVAVKWTGIERINEVTYDPVAGATKYTTGTRSLDGYEPLTLDKKGRTQILVFPWPECGEYEISIVESKEAQTLLSEKIVLKITPYRAAGPEPPRLDQPEPAKQLEMDPKAAAREAMAKLRDVNARDHFKRTPLHEAALNGNVAMVEALLARGALVTVSDLQGSTPLHQAARAANLEIVTMLAGKGADVNAKDLGGRGPLHIAAASSDPQACAVADFLIAKGAKVNEGDRSGQSPLHHATSSGTKTTAELLISKGADINAHESQGATPLHCAAKPRCYMSYQNDPERVAIAELLIAKGATIDALDVFKRTPLHDAATLGNQRVLELLIEKGAAVNAKDEFGDTPLKKAKGQVEIVKILKKHGAKE